MYETNRAESVRKLAELLEGVHVAMLVTRSGDGTLRARPMATQDVPFDGTKLTFLSSYASAKVGEVGKSPEVCVVCADSAKNRYMSLSGRAEVVRDAGSIRAFWRPRYTEWFPKGVEDPDLALLAVEISRAEYWDSPGLLGMVGKMFGGFSGEPPAVEEDPEELHRTVKL